MIVTDSNGVVLADGVSPFTATPVVPTEGTDEKAALNITKNTTEGGVFEIKIILSDAMAQEGAGSLSTSGTICDFTVEIDAPCVDGRQVVVLTGSNPGQIIDATAVFSSFISGDYLDGDQIFEIESIDFPNPTADIYSYCTQEADGNIQAGDIYRSGIQRASGVQAFVNGVWSQTNRIQYYQTGNNNTGQIKMRLYPANGGGQNTDQAVDWSTIPAGTLLRFSTGKKQIGWINQAGTRCDAIFNYLGMFVYYRGTVSSGFGPIVLFPDPVDIPTWTNGGVCFAMTLDQCVSPLCPTASKGYAPYAANGFAPVSSAGSYTSCNGGPSQPYCV